MTLKELEQLTSQQRYQQFESADLDLILAPWGFGGTDNLAQEGALALLKDQDLVKKLSAIGHQVNEIHPPGLGPFEIQEEKQKIRNLEAILTVNDWVAEQMKVSLKNNHIPILLGGDASLTMGSVAGLVEHYGKENLGIVWFSNHLCNSSPRVTQSWNANRMALTVFTFNKEPKHEDFKALMDFRNLGNPILEPRNIVHLGINHKSAQEQENVEHSFYTMDDIDELGAKQSVNLALEDLKHCDHIHVIWDVNALGLSGVSNFSLGQLRYREALVMARELDLHLRRSGKLSSIDVVEYCPSREAWDRRGEAAEWATDIITNIFGENIFNAARKY